MAVIRFPTDVRVEGNFQSDSMSLPTGSVSDTHVAANAGIDADKLEHNRFAGSNFDLAIGATPVAREEIVWVAQNAGTIRGFHALLNVTGSTTDVDFDLKKNGTTVLSATINVINTDADRLVKDGTLSVTSFVADDVFSMELTVTTSTGAQGPFAFAYFDEQLA
jgi:hypothetical protein